MNSLDEMLNPNHRMKAPAGFADQVMARISLEERGAENRFPPLRRILGMAAMVLICITIGFSLGGAPDRSQKKTPLRQNLKEFQESHHLLPHREASIIMFIPESD